MIRRFIYVPYIPPVVLISAGQYYSLAIDKDGKGWGWGYNDFGNLGTNDKTSRRTPVSILGSNKTFCSISAGDMHALGLDNHGRVWSWGDNIYGNLGNNTIISKLTPVSILGNNKTFCSIAASFYQSMGIDNSGQVWGWGYNGYGQLGDNSKINKCTPVSILGAKKTFCKISVGFGFSLGLDKNGRVWSWGDNYYGELGNNATISRLTPVSILGTNKTFCSIAAGDGQSLGLDKYGQVWSWGRNADGELGINSATYKSTPVSILGSKKTFCSIAAGYSYSMGIDKNGLVWSWGYNSHGILGDNTTIARCTPVSILGIRKTFCSISVGSYLSLGIDINGQAWAWGENYYGELGDNTTIDRHTPVMIKTI